jgi:hypothetical protein
MNTNTTPEHTKAVMYVKLWGKTTLVPAHLPEVFVENVITSRLHAR